MPKRAAAVVLCAIFSACFVNSTFAQLEKLIVMTENTPPYNYLEDGQLRGAAVELLLEISSYMGQPIERNSIRVVPWARGFRELQHGPNRMLFVTTRTAEREAQFLWAGPVTVDYFALIAKRNKKLRITQTAQLKNLRIGVVRDDVAEDMLEKLDIDQKLITKGNESVGVAKMLVAGRVDLWPIDPRGARTILKSIGANPDEYEVVANLRAGPLYYAFSKDVDVSLVAEFQQAIDALRITRPELFPDGHAEVGVEDIPTLQ